MVKMSILVYLLFLGINFSLVYGYRDGARENSCYNQTIDHGAGSFLLDCESASCRYLLIIKEVVNETTLELGNETEYYECGKIYGVEVANSLNAPEGFLVQARSGTEDSSEIIGTFLYPNEVQERDPSISINFKILECQRHQSAGPELYPNSATHPNTVNTAGKLQLFWRAPNCTGETLPNIIIMWYTIVQQLLIGYNPAKHINLTYSSSPTIQTSTTDSITQTPMNTRTTQQVQPSQTPTTRPGLSQEVKIIIISSVSGSIVFFIGAPVVIFIIVTVVICNKKRQQLDSYSTTNKDTMSWNDLEKKSGEK